MHKQPAYLYKNVQELYTDLDPKWMGYRKVYARTLKLYKGIDNSFTIKLMNGDQKLLDLTNQGQTLWFQILNRDTAELKYITSMGIDCNTAPNSYVTLTIPEGDLAPILSGNYMYSAYLEDISGKKQILYGDSQFGASVPVEIIENAFPNILPSQEVDHAQFVTAYQISYVIPDNSLYTSWLDAHPENNSNTALHTVCFYCTEYTGTVELHVTLANGPTDITTWSVLETITVTPDQTVFYKNFNGIFNMVRFRMIPDTHNTGTIDKILYRS